MEKIGNLLRAYEAVKKLGDSVGYTGEKEIKERLKHLLFASVCEGNYKAFIRIMRSSIFTANERVPSNFEHYCLASHFLPLSLTLLQVACLYTRKHGEKFIQYLLSRPDIIIDEVDVDPKGHTTALGYALIYSSHDTDFCSLKTVKLLIEAGANVNYTNDQGETLLMLGLVNGIHCPSLDALLLVIHGGADILNWRDKKTGYTYLMLVAQKNMAEQLKIVISLCPELLEIIVNGQTAYSVAGSMECKVLLLEGILHHRTARYFHRLPKNVLHMICCQAVFLDSFTNVIKEWKEDDDEWDEMLDEMSKFSSFIGAPSVSFVEKIPENGGKTGKKEVEADVRKSKGNMLHEMRQNMADCISLGATKIDPESERWKTVVAERPEKRRRLVHVVESFKEILTLHHVPWQNSTIGQIEETIDKQYAYTKKV